jgi:hypothetical protein
MCHSTSPFADAHPFGTYKKIEDCKPAYPSKLFTNAACKDFVGAVLTKDRAQRLGTLPKPCLSPHLTEQNPLLFNIYP